MTAMSKTAAPQSHAVVFATREWPLARSIHRVLGLPERLLDVAFFVCSEGPKQTIYERIKEPPLRDDESQWERLVDAARARMERDPVLGPILGREVHSGVHTGASATELARALEDDGYSVTTISSALALRTAPNPAKEAEHRQRFENFRGSRYSEDGEVSRKVQAWLDNGGDPLDGSSLQRIRATSLPALPVEIELWGPTEERLCQLLARLALLGPGDTQGTQAFSRLALGSPSSFSEGILDRWSMLVPKLERVGFSKDDMLRLALVSEPQSSAQVLIIDALADLPRLRAVGALANRQLAPVFTWFDVVAASVRQLGAKEKVKDLLASSPDLGAAGPYGLLDLLNLDPAQAPQTARALERNLDTVAQPDGAQVMLVAWMLAKIDQTAYDALLLRVATSVMENAFEDRAFKIACERLPRVALRWILENPSVDFWADAVKTLTQLLSSKPTRAEIDALLALLAGETDADRADTLVALLKKFGVEASAPKPPAELSEVDVVATVALDSAIIRIFDPTSFKDEGGVETLLALVSSGRGVAFSTAEDGTYKVHVTGKEAVPADAAFFGLKVKSGRVSVVGEGLGLTFLAPKGNWRAAVVAVPQGAGKVHYRVHLDDGAVKKRKVKELDVIEPL